MKLLSIIAIFLALWAICTRAEDVLLNEVATKGQQFIEIKKKDHGVISLHNYGIVIAEQNIINRAKELKIRAVLDLAEQIFIYPYIQIIHFGNMNFPNLMELAPPQPRWKIFGSDTANNWLEIKNKNFITVFLTKSNRNVLDVIKANPGRPGKILIKDEIKSYLQESVVDFLAIRKFDGPDNDNLVNEIIQYKSPKEERQPPRHNFITLI